MLCQNHFIDRISLTQFGNYIHAYGKRIYVIVVIFMANGVEF